MSSNSTLSVKQKRILAQEAQDAFRRAEEYHAVDLPPEVERSCKSARFTFWRQREAGTAVGSADPVSFTELTQRDYMKVLSHFEKLSGKAGKAFDHTLRDIQASASTTPEGAGLLRDMYQRAKVAGLGDNYIATIARSKFRCSDIARLNMQQLRHLVYTVNNRAAQKLNRSAS